MFFHSACVVELGDGNGEGVEEVGAIMGIRIDVGLRVGWVRLFVCRAFRFCGAVDLLCEGANGVACGLSHGVRFEVLSLRFIGAGPSPALQAPLSGTV